MIKEFVAKFDSARETLLERYRETHPESYQSIVTDVIRLISKDEDYGVPDPERITVIDHGDYQGTLLFVVAGKGYQPSDYWAVFVSYGSCSGCDTFCAIRDETYSDEAPTESQAKQYFTLALHIVQGIQPIPTHFAGEVDE